MWLIVTTFHLVPRCSLTDGRRQTTYDDNNQNVAILCNGRLKIYQKHLFTNCSQLLLPINMQWKLSVFLLYVVSGRRLSRTDEWRNKKSSLNFTDYDRKIGLDLGLVNILHRYCYPRTWLCDVVTGHWSNMSGSAGRQSLHDSDVDSSHVNDSAISLSSISVDR